MIRYNTQLFQQLLIHITTLTDASACFYTEDFQPTEVKNGLTNPLCSMIKKSEQISCLNTDAMAFQKAKTSDEPILHYFCHFGLKEIVMRLAVNNVIYGYFLIGPFRDPQNKTQDVKKIESFCEKYGASKEKMLHAYNKVAKFSEEKFESIKVLATALFEYAKQQNIVTLHGNDFENKIKPFVKENLQADLSTKSLCDAFFLSPKQLYNTFIKATGLSPKKYVTEQRVIHAKNLIMTTDTPLPQVAEKVGIADYNYFIKVFKSYDGHTPLYYRKTKKEDKPQ